MSAHMWECHLGAPSAVWVEEADRLWGSLSRGYRGYAWSSILNQSPDSHWSAITAQKLCCCALICLQLQQYQSPRPSCACRGSLSGVHCTVGPVYVTVRGMQPFGVRVHFYHSEINTLQGAGYFVITSLYMFNHKMASLISVLFNSLVLLVFSETEVRGQVIAIDMNAATWYGHAGEHLSTKWEI